MEGAAGAAQATPGAVEAAAVEGPGMGPGMGAAVAVEAVEGAVEGAVGAVEAVEAQGAVGAVGAVEAVLPRSRREPRSDPRSRETWALVPPTWR
jgi:hypothetical protein